MEPIKEAYTIDEASRASGLSYTKVAKLVQDGCIPCIQIGRRKLILPDDLKAFLESHRKT